MKIGNNIVVVLGIGMLLCASLQAKAQEAVMVKDSIYSAILQEERPLEILYPKGYQANLPGGYDVLYVTDGISDYLQHEWEWLQWEGFIPKNMIVVGIPNTSHNGINMRNRDFTPTHTSDVSGGAQQFLAFFREELIPHILKKYPVKSTGSTLTGSSLGGLFVLYALLHEPRLFTSYIAIDPSLWWDDLYMDKLALHKLDSIGTFSNTLYIAGREGKAYSEMGIAAMDSILHLKSPRGLQWTCVQLPNETHYSTILKGTWDGLKFSYGGYYASSGGYYSSRNIDFRPMNGTVIKSIPFHFNCFNLKAAEYIHYTTDGSFPGLSSPAAGETTELQLSRDATVILHSMGIREEYNRTDSMHFNVVDSFQPGALPAKAVAGGLHYTWYEGEWGGLADMGKAKPGGAGFADSGFDVNKLPATKNYACVLSGYLRITEAGYYIFSMGEGNTNSRVYVGKQLVLGAHMKKGVGENYLLPLEKGFYPYRVEYFHRKGDPELDAIYMEMENGPQHPVPVAQLYAPR